MSSETHSAETHSAEPPAGESHSAPEKPSYNTGEAQAEPPESGVRSRLRFAEFDRRAFPDGHTTIGVRLEWTEEDVFMVDEDATHTREGETRAAALAVLRAVELATDGILSLELMGAKAVRVFDSWVVIVSARAQAEGSEYSLVGSYACANDATARGAALATLNATNRIVEKYLSS